MGGARLSGTAVVTGGGRGIGREVARSLAAHGAEVAVLARTGSEIEKTAALIADAGHTAAPFAVDVTSEDQLKRVVREIETRMGDIELLVSNAAIPGPIGHIWDDDYDPEDWWRCFDVNLRGPFLCARAVLPGMIERRRGRIINVASAAGTFGHLHDPYSSSKAALIRFTECLAMDLARSGVKAFSIHPGGVRTAMVDEIIDSGADHRLLGDFYARSHTDREQAGRAITAEPAARLVLQLASGVADSLSGCYFGRRSPAPNEH